MRMHWLWFFWDVLLDRREKRETQECRFSVKFQRTAAHLGEPRREKDDHRKQHLGKPKYSVLVCLLSKLLLCLAVSGADTWFNLPGTEAWAHWDETLKLLPTEGFVSSVVSSVFTESRDGDGAGTYVYQKRGELESRRTQKTFQCDTNHTPPWDRLQCTMGEGRIQQRRDKPESK